MEKPFLPQKLGKWAKKWLKIGFLEFKETWSLIFHVLILCIKFLFALFLLKSCRKNLVPEIMAKIPSANQVARFLNVLFLLSKLMKQSHFSMVIWPIWSLDSKIALTNGINSVFCMVVQFHEN